MKNFFDLQRGYQRNRLGATSRAPSQSTMFFEIWRKYGLMKALSWWKAFKKRQGLNHLHLRMFADALGCLLVSTGAVQIQIIAVIAIFLMLNLGGTGDEEVRDGGNG